MTNSTAKVWTQAKCAKCGKDCSVPFIVDPKRPVYCRECYKPKNRQSVNPSNLKFNGWNHSEKAKGFWKSPRRQEPTSLGEKDQAPY